MKKLFIFLSLFVAVLLYADPNARESEIAQTFKMEFVKEVTLSNGSTQIIYWVFAKENPALMSQYYCVTTPENASDQQVKDAIVASFQSAFFDELALANGLGKASPSPGEGI